MFADGVIEWHILDKIRIDDNYLVLEDNKVPIEDVAYLIIDGIVEYGNRL